MAEAPRTPGTLGSEELCKTRHTTLVQAWITRCVVERSNDSSTRPTTGHACNGSAMAGFAAAHQAGDSSWELQNSVEATLTVKCAIENHPRTPVTRYRCAEIKYSANSASVSHLACNTARTEGIPVDWLLRPSLDPAGTMVGFEFQSARVTDFLSSPTTPSETASSLVN